MCGIACIVSTKGKASRNQFLNSILSQIEHRGTDGEGLYSVDLPKTGLGVTLGHKRLSIVDLNARSNQPFSTANKDIITSFNGEIYNYDEIRTKLQNKGHRFQTDSDTEVIAIGYAEFGLDIFHFLEGMFSIVLLCVSENKLIVARDSFGIKPLYYYLAEETLTFCSESHALAATNCIRPDTLRLKASLTFGYNVLYPSVFSGIQQISKGSIYIFDLKKEQNWSTPETIPITNKYSSQIRQHALHEENIEAELRQCVEMQTMSDVGFGVLLSGGLDSGLITALLKQHGHIFPVFTAGDPSLEGSDAQRAKQLSNEFSLPFYSINIKAHNVPKLIQETYSLLSEPILDSALIFSSALSSLASDNNTKVLLSGAGGDELFYGYPRYNRSSIIRMLMRESPSLVQDLIKWCFPHFKSKHIHRLKFPAIDFAMQIAGSPRLVDNVDFTKMLKSSTTNLKQMYRHGEKHQVDFDTDVYLVENILLGLDQTTMRYTIEGRVPFLSKPLYTMARSIPPQAHMENGKLKSILRKIGEKYLPSSYLEAPKSGFSGPVEFWVNSNINYFSRSAYTTLDALKIINSKRKDPDIKTFSTHELFNLTALGAWLGSR